MAPDLLIPDLLPVLRRCCRGSCGIALGGSHAKGAADALSDVDLYLFASAVLPARQRTALVRDALAHAVGVVSWGADDPFVQGGTDFEYAGQRIECWFRDVGHVESALRESLEGKVRREYVAWTVMGFFGHTVLADLHTMQIIEDPDGLLARWKAATAVYPEPLRDAIVGRFLGEALFWPGNPHYHAAVERGDGIYTSAIVQQVVHALIQVVFALNRAYFPGEKNLAAALAKLPVQPPEFGARVQALLGASAAGEAQRQGLSLLVSEVDALVREDGGRES